MSISFLLNISLAAPDPQKKGLVKLCRKVCRCQNLGSSDQIAPFQILMMSQWSIKGIAARADYFRQVDTVTVAKMDTKTNQAGVNNVEIK